MLDGSVWHNCLHLSWYLSCDTTLVSLMYTSSSCMFASYSSTPTSLIFQVLQKYPVIMVSSIPPCQCVIEKVIVNDTDAWFPLSNIIRIPFEVMHGSQITQAKHI